MHSANDLIAGTASGLLCATLEHPFDTVKVRMQSYGGTYRRSVQSLVRAEGVLGLYRGLPARLGASGLEHGLTLGGYKGALRLVGADEHCPRWWEMALGGVGGGLATTAVLTPLELVKCTMQARPGLTQGNSLHCAHDIYRAGGLRGFYRGGRAMLLREVYGTTVWCGTNDILRARLTPAGTDPSELSAARTMVAGGCSGVVYAALAHPADVLKTRIQVDPRFQQCSLLAAARAMVRHHGWRRGLYGGFGIVAVCSFPSSAAVFLSFELFRSLLKTEEREPRSLSGKRLTVTGEHYQPA